MTCTSVRTKLMSNDALSVTAPTGLTYVHLMHAGGCVGDLAAAEKIAGSCQQLQFLQACELGSMACLDNIRNLSQLKQLREHRPHAAAADAAHRADAPAAAGR
jgi:hypothetical protein